MADKYFIKTNIATKEITQAEYDNYRLIVQNSAVLSPALKLVLLDSDTIFKEKDRN